MEEALPHFPRRLEGAGTDLMLRVGYIKRTHSDH